jgi:hypothetical protein
MTIVIDMISILCVVILLSFDSVTHILLLLFIIIIIIVIIIIVGDKSGQLIKCFSFICLSLLIFCSLYSKCEFHF